jgi:hypothetical protein
MVQIFESRAEVTSPELERRAHKVRFGAHARTMEIARNSDHFVQLQSVANQITTYELNTSQVEQGEAAFHKSRKSDSDLRCCERPNGL